MRVKPYSEREDNLICTLVKMYNEIGCISIGIRRASYHLNREESSIRHRYYKVLRPNREVFSTQIGTTTVFNCARIPSSVIYENLNFQEYEQRKLSAEEEEV